MNSAWVKWGGVSVVLVAGLVVASIYLAPRQQHIEAQSEGVDVNITSTVTVAPSKPSPMHTYAMNELAMATAQNKTANDFTIHYVVAFTSGPPSKKTLAYDRGAQTLAMIPEKGQGLRYSNVTDSVISSAAKTRAGIEAVEQFGALQAR